MCAPARAWETAILPVQFHGCIVIDNHGAVSVIDKHAAVPVRGELVQAGIGHNNNLIAKLGPAGSDSAVQNTVVVPSRRAYFVLIIIQRNTEEVDAFNARLRSLAHSRNQRLQSVLVLPRH